MRSRVAVVSLLLGGLVVPAACGNELPASTTCADVELLVAASNYEASVVCGAPGCAISRETSGVNLGKDPMLARSAGRAFFLARDTDRIFELDAACGKPTAEIHLDVLATPDPRAGHARTTNAHDVAVAPDGTLVVPLYDAAKLAFVRGGVADPSDVVDLSPYDPDGNPQADAVSIVTVDGAPKAFVTLERLDDDAPAGKYLRSVQPSQMLRVDVATRQVEAVVELTGRNPFNAMGVLGGALFLAEPGNFDAADDDLAGIERFDAATSTTRLLVRERELGASIAELAVTEGCGAAIVVGPQRNVNPTSVVTFDPDTGEVFAIVDRPVLGPTPGYDLQGLAWRDDLLYVGDRRRAGGGYAVHVLARKGASCVLEDTGRTIELPMPPVALRAAAPKVP